METLLINRKLLPEPIFSYIKSEKVRVSTEKNRVVLSPVKKKQSVDEITRELQAMCGNGKLSVERFLKERAEAWGD